MTTDRQAEAGVTLIELLAALAVSALIGVAGFSLLDTVLRTEKGVADQLEDVLRIDRAFQLLALDLKNTLEPTVGPENGLALRQLSHTIEWQGTDSGLFRRIKLADGSEITQALLDVRSRMAVGEGPAPMLTLTVPELDIRRSFRLPMDESP